MLTYVTVFALVLAYLALVGAFLALRELGRLRRATRLLNRRADGGESIAELLDRTREDTALLAEQVRDLRATAEKQQSVAAVAPIATEPDGASLGALRNVALVRYDAFDDMSGHLSFSLALLNENGDGVTVSAIAARTDTRVYAKSIAGGTGQQDLTPEEIQAVRTATGSKRPARKAS